MQLQALTLVPTHESYRQAVPCLANMLQEDAASIYVPVPSPTEETRALEMLAPFTTHLSPHTTLVVATSGTTGTPKYAQLGARQLRASITATHQVLGGPGAWLLPLPPHHIAGIQVLLRSYSAGYDAELQDTRNGFQLANFAAATSRLLTRTPNARHYTSLVPTQLHKVLSAATTGDPAGQAAQEALGAFDGILVGGAALSPELAEAAMEAGARLVCTYGASETAGGCVYDGHPLPGTKVKLDHEGRIWLGGATIASGYLNFPHHPAWQLPGWFRTDDHGSWVPSAENDTGEVRLQVNGRLDDAISSGGLTIFPHVVEKVLARHPQVAHVVVLGRPDARLGEHVTAVVIPPAGTPAPTLESVQQWVSENGLSATAAPRELIVRDTLPLRGIGKVDRRALRESLPPTV